MNEMEEAARSGVRFALDDVMLDSANLAVLSRCKFHIVKIDRRLVADIRPDQPRPEWLAGLAALLAATDLQVIAEGVETPAHATALLGLGCRLGQGFGIARPMPVEHIPGWFSWQTLAPCADDAACASPARCAPNRSAP